jgi:GNAT superfamily N-acetyltransferase
VIGAGEPAPTHLTDRVRTAHGDAWQLHGRLRLPYGGGALELPGIRLMASGIAQPQWNNGDVTDPALVDLEAVRSWYAGFDVPWGVRVPAGLPWRDGRLLFRKRCMALRPADARPAPQVAGVVLRVAGPEDLDEYARLDAAAFDEDDPGPTREWTRPMLGADGVRLLLAELDGRPAGVAYAMRTDGRAGPCVGIAGVGVLPAARRRGLGAALTWALVEWGFGSGADLAWLNPDTEEALRVYRRLGFVETGGFDVYVDLG